MSETITYCASGCTRRDAHLSTCTRTDLHHAACEDEQCRGCHPDLCPGCEPRLAEHGILCAHCYRRLTTFLDGDPANPESLGSVCAWLADNLGQHLRSVAGEKGARSANPGEGMVTVLAVLRDLQVGLVEMAVDFITSRDMRPLEDTAPDAVLGRLRPWVDTLAGWEPIADQLDYFDVLRSQAHGVCPWRGKHPDASDQTAVRLFNAAPETAAETCERFNVSDQWLKDAKRRKGLTEAAPGDRPLRYWPWDVFAILHPTAARDYEARLARLDQQRDNVAWTSEAS